MHMIDTQRAEVRFLIDALRAASRQAMTVQREMTAAALSKDDRSPVTVGDYAVQAVVGAMLEKALPADALVGEEDAGALREPANTGLLGQVVHFVERALPGATDETVCGWIDRGNAEPGGRFWTLDPIDGTKGFLRGEQYAVALALIENGEVVLGGLGCPNLANGCEEAIGGPGSVVIAARGEGTWASPLENEAWTALRVSGVADPKDARVLRSVESGHTNVSQLDIVLGRMGVQADPVRLDSQAKYGVLAGGRGDLLLRLLSADRPDYRECIWDQAAGAIVIEEAGGRITDLAGKPLDFGQGRTLANNAGVLASNGHLHEAALSALAEPPAS